MNLYKSIEYDFEDKIIDYLKSIGVDTSKIDPKTLATSIDLLAKKSTPVEKIIFLVNHYFAKEKIIFAFRHNVSTIFHSYHHHDFYELIYIVEGKGELFVDEKKYLLKKGDMAFVPPNTLHKLIVESDEENLRCIMNFDEKYLKSLSSPNTDLTRFLDILNKRNTNLISFSNVDHKRLLSLFNRLNNNYLSRDYGDDLRVKLTLTDIFLKINSCAIEEEDSTIISGFNENSLVTKAIEFIDKNYQNKITLEKISEYLCMSVSRISHLFKEETGLSIIEYTIKKRLLLAKKMLLEGESTSKIADSLGFSSLPSFYKQFKKEFKITPKEFLIYSK